MTPLIGVILGAVGVTLLNRILNGSIWPSKSTSKKGSESKDKIIEVDDYEVLE